MGAINLLGAAWPGGLWATLIKLFYSFITNYAWAIIVFTLCLKLLLYKFQRCDLKIGQG